MIKSMSARDKNALIILITIIIAAVSYIYLFEPTWLDYQGNTATLEQSQSQLDTIKQYLNNLESINKQIKDNTDKIGNLSLQLPNHPRTDELLYMLQQAAEGANVEVVKLSYNDNSSTTPADQGNVQSLSYQLQVKGNKNEIVSYIKDVENLKRKLIISDVKIEENSQDYSLNAYINFNAYYLNDASVVKYQPNKLIP